jgi:hypothetical protein
MASGAPTGSSTNGGVIPDGNRYEVMCSDGTISYSGGIQGACSYHGGLAGMGQATITAPLAAE